MKKLYREILSSVDACHKNTTRSHINSRVLIIDGTNTFIRCWSVIPTLNDDGDHVGGAVGALKSIGYAIKQTSPTRVIVVFDGKGGSSSRKKIFSGYKAQRANNKIRVNRQYAGMMTDEDERESMKRQFVWLVEMLNKLPVTTLIYDNVEADDVMAYIATQLIKEEDQSVIMSTDKDFLQLVNNTTIIWSPTKKKIYNKTKVKEEFGIESKNLLLYRVLDGDVSDNIPGIKGCGIKTILKRIPEMSEDAKLTIDDIFRICEERQGDKKRIKLYDDIITAKDQIYMNHRLMQLTTQEISGTTKMNILTKFDEITKPLNKREFLSICMKYKVTNNFGNDIIGWLQSTFQTLKTK